MSGSMLIVYLGVGSNLGNRCENLLKALNLLKESSGVSGFELSKLYETSPVDFLEQDKFLNGVVRIYTNLRPREVLNLCQDIERRLQREKTVRFGPRNIDVDLLFYDSRIINENDFIVPHPRAHVRLFVLKPMCDLDPDFMHPLLQKSMRRLVDEFTDATQTIEEYKC